MAAINPYLLFNGNAEEAFNFYKSVFGTEFQMVMRFKDAPPEHQGPEGEGNKIMHIALPVGDDMLMASDAGQHKVETGSNFSISISASSQEEADKLFNGLSAGGQVTLPMGKTFWGSYFGMLKDKFDVHWMVSFDSNQPK